MASQLTALIIPLVFNSSSVSGETIRRLWNSSMSSVSSFLTVAAFTPITTRAYLPIIWDSVMIGPCGVGVELAGGDGIPLLIVGGLGVGVVVPVGPVVLELGFGVGGIGLGSDMVAICLPWNWVEYR